MGSSSSLENVSTCKQKTPCASPKAPGQRPPRAPPPKETHVSLHPGSLLGSAPHNPPFLGKNLWKMSPLALNCWSCCTRAYGAGKVMVAGRGSAGSTHGNASSKKKNKIKRHLPFLVCPKIIYGISREMQQRSAAHHGTSPSPHARTPRGLTHCPVPPLHLAAHPSHQNHPQPQETGQRWTLLPPPRFGPVSLTRLPPALPSIPPTSPQRGGDPAVRPQENDGVQGDPNSGHAGETPTPVLGTSPHPKREDRNQSRGRKPTPLPSHPSRLLHARRWKKSNRFATSLKHGAFLRPALKSSPVLPLL